LKRIPYNVRVPNRSRREKALNWKKCTTHSREKGDSMNLDPGQLNQVLSRVPYPIGKAQLVQFAQQHGANEQIIGLLDRLPDKTFNSQQEVQDTLGGLGNLGNLGGFKL
jgi:Protein of unknown function (DUF2795)